MLSRLPNEFSRILSNDSFWSCFRNSFQDISSNELYRALLRDFSCLPKMHPRFFFKEFSLGFVHIFLLGFFQTIHQEFLLRVLPQFLRRFSPKMVLAFFSGIPQIHSGIFSGLPLKIPVFFFQNASQDSSRVSPGITPGFPSGISSGSRKEFLS